MKEKITKVALAMLLLLSLCGCGGGKTSENPSTTPPPSEVVTPSETPEVTEFPSDTVEVDYQGLCFKMPAYFDVQWDKVQAPNLAYYPSPENYYATLLFRLGYNNDSMTNAEFEEYQTADSGITIYHNVMHDDNELSIESFEKVTGAELPGCILVFRETSSTTAFSYLFDEHDGAVIYVTLNFDDTDESDYNYIDDFKAMIRTAQLSGGSRDPKPEPSPVPTQYDFQGIRFEIPEYCSIYKEEDDTFQYLEHEDTGFAFLVDESKDWKEVIKRYDSENAFVSYLVEKTYTPLVDPEQETLVSKSLFVAGHTAEMRIGKLKDFPATYGCTIVSDVVHDRIIFVFMSYNDSDATKHDYISDYQKMLQTAVDIEVSDVSPQETDHIPANGLPPEFIEAMDAYEAFYDEYCEYIRLFTEDPTNMEYLTRYTELMEQATEMNAAFEKWDTESMSYEETKYYLEVNSRVMQKLLAVSIGT